MSKRTLSLVHSTPQPVSIATKTINGTITAKPGTKARALQIESRLFELFESSRRDFIETGQLIIEVEKDELWKHLTTKEGEAYTSLDNWMSTALPYGRTTAFKARDIVRKFDGVPVETLQEIPRVNLQRLARLSPRRRKSAKSIQAALTLPEKELVRYILTAKSGDPLPSESGVMRMVFTFTPAEHKRVMKGLDRAAGDEHITREAALVRIMAAYVGQSKKPSARAA